MSTKNEKRLVIKTNVKAGCGEESAPPPGDNGGSRNQVRIAPSTVLRLPLLR
jgi:hypothetical protein